MSFISILKKIGSVALGVEHIAAPIVSALYPPAAPWLSKLDDLTQHLQASVIATEVNNPADGQGGIKSAAVIADIDSYFGTMNAGLALAGKTVTDDPALRQAAINATVAAFNADAAWKASFKIGDLKP